MNVVTPVGGSPSFAAFRAAYDQGRGSLLWRRGVADLDTPVAAFLKLAGERPNSFLLGPGRQGLDQSPCLVRATRLRARSKAGPG